MREFIKRLRIALSAVIGFLTGKYLAALAGHHASEFFSGGFMIGVVVSQFLFHVYDRLSGSDEPAGEKERPS